MSSDWEDLELLTRHLTYWTDLHKHLIATTQTGIPDLPAFGLPYLDGNRLTVPDYPGNGPTTSDAWVWFSIVHHSGLYTLVSSGFDRGNKYSDRPRLSSDRFSYVAKHFLYYNLAEKVRRSKSLATRLAPINLQFIRRGVADGWEAVPDKLEHAPQSFDTIYRHTSDPRGAFYISDSYETAPTFYLDKSWDELDRLYADGIPGIDHIPIPDDPGSGK